jgi:serine/threonine-protein kinase SRPK3
LDHFDISGPNGKHACLVFPVLGINLWDLLDQYAPEGLRLPVVRSLARQLLQGVSYMHSKAVIHTDLKPENIALERVSLTVDALMRKQPLEAGASEREYLEKACLEDPQIKIVDFGNGCWVEKHFTDDIQTTQYRAPEVVIRSRYGPPVDVWSVACIVFELATGDQLFHPHSGKRHSKDDDHVALVTELLGAWPKEFALGGKRSGELFTRKGKVKNITKLENWPLDSVLRDKYQMTPQNAEGFASFLLPMLAIRPKDRATAHEALQHPWLKLDEQLEPGQSPFLPYDDKKDKDKDAGGRSDADDESVNSEE